MTVTLGLNSLSKMGAPVIRETTAEELAQKAEQRQELSKSKNLKFSPKKVIAELPKGASPIAS